jgi:hypothetical protein
MTMGVVVLVIFFIAVAIAIRVLAGGMDHDRVRQYVQSRGGRVIEANWAPFGKGWFGEKGDRIYKVRFLDRDGNEHRAHCKTSTFSGVYFTEDQIVRYAPAPVDEHAASPEEENRRLREEVERLRGEQGL